MSTSLVDPLAYVRVQQGGSADADAPAEAEEVVVDVDLLLETDDGLEEVILQPMDSSDRARRIGRIPSEALAWILHYQYGPRWAHDTEPEVIAEDMVMSGYSLDPAGWSRINALRVILTAPSEKSPFHRSWQAFAFLACSLSGRPVKWEELAVPSPVEAAIAVHVVNQLRPLPFQPAVEGGVAALCLAQGLWCLPPILAWAQDTVIEALVYDGATATPSMLAQVERYIDRLRADPSLESTELDPMDGSIEDDEAQLRGQALRALHVRELIEAALLHGDVAADRVHAAHKES